MANFFLPHVLLVGAILALLLLKARSANRAEYEAIATRLYISVGMIFWCLTRLWTQASQPSNHGPQIAELAYKSYKIDVDLDSGSTLVLSPWLSMFI